MTNWIKGNDLSPSMKEEARRRFVHRSTGDYKRQSTPYPLQFKDDADWLANTLFAVKKNPRQGFDERIKYCCSSPTWPNNPELRDTHGALLKRITGLGTPND